MNNLTIIKNNISTWLFYIFTVRFFWLASIFISTYKTNKNKSFMLQAKSYISSNLSTFDVLFLLYIIAIVIVTFFFSKKIRFFSLRNYYPFFSHAFITTISQFSIFGIGIFFSVLSSPIKDWLADGQALIYPNAFQYIIFLLFLTVFTFMYNIISTKVVDEHKLDKIENIIQLAPSSAFSSDLSMYTDVIDDWAYELTKTTDKTHKLFQGLAKYLKIESDAQFPFDQFKSVCIDDDLKKQNKKITEFKEKCDTILLNNEEHIRAALISYARLAASFDGRTPDEKKGHVYRANLMIMFELEKKDSEYDFKFIPELIKQHNNIIKYYLELDSNYSVRLYTSKKKIYDKDYKPLVFNKDDEVNACSFPLFLDKECSHYNCFGAPMAVFEISPQFTPNTLEKVEEWKEKEPGVSLIKEARDYYNKEKKARSIISIPLVQSRYIMDQDSHNKIIGVVNIYRDEADIMHSSNAKLKQFSDITTSLNSSLSRIIVSTIIIKAISKSLEKLLERC